jgi:exosortase A-associated hydrolase 2
VDAFFIDASFGQRFCVFHPPVGNVPMRGGLVYIHPFAEELNRCRRMAYLQARAFAQVGYAVLMVDLHGCGDSSGDFGDATWDIWLDDVKLARQWLEQRVGGPVWLWGMRAACLLVAQAIASDPRPVHALLWQPVLSGRQHLQQLLRLKLAGQIVQSPVAKSDKGRSGTDALLAQLELGHSLEIAGYVLSPALAKGLGLATLQLSPFLRGVCLEVSGPVDAAQPLVVSPAMRALVAQSLGTPCQITAQALAGAAFWQVQDAPVCEALIDASLAAVQAVDSS